MVSVLSVHDCLDKMLGPKVTWNTLGVGESGRGLTSYCVLEEERMPALEGFPSPLLLSNRAISQCVCAAHI
jgi:hypothetical protein